jgi:hypothetical protein
MGNCAVILLACLVGQMKKRLVRLREKNRPDRAVQMDSFY